jgi:tetratricopeptide (TPR) repeat protein
MLYLRKTLFLFFGLWPFLSAKAYTIADTINKKSISRPAKGVYQLNDFITYLRDGISYIKKDSLDKGIHFLAVGMKGIVAEKNVMVVLDYEGLEIFNLIAVIDSGKLSPRERELGQAFFKEAFTKKTDPHESDLVTYLKLAPGTLFTRRIKLLLLALNNERGLSEALDNLLKNYPLLLQANILKAEKLYDAGRYEESITFCTKVTSIWPEYAFAWHLRGKSYAKLNMPDKAATDDSVAVRIFPTDFEAAYDRSDALLDQDKYRDAIAGFQLGMLVKPGYLYPAYNLARCYRGLGIPDSALYYINLHIERNTDDGDGYDLKGDIYYDKNDYSRAIELYDQSIKLEPTRASFHDDRADAYFYADSVDQALKDFQIAIRLDKKRSYTNDRIGDCYFKKGEYRKAISSYQTAIRIDPNNKYAFVDLNYCYVKMGKIEDGLVACKRAVEIDSTYDSALGNLGWTYYCVGNFDACIEYSYKALKYDEKATYAMFNIALATLCKGDFEKAKGLYRYYIAKCKEKGYEVTSGPVKDLNDLIQRKVYPEQAAFIIEHILQQKE